MEAKVTIAQPFPVLWTTEDRNVDYQVANWIRANVTGKHEIIILGQHAKKVILGSEGAETANFNVEDCLFLFENVRDALLFKLTWGGR